MDDGGAFYSAPRPQMDPCTGLTPSSSIPATPPASLPPPTPHTREIQFWLPVYRLCLGDLLRGPRRPLQTLDRVSPGWALPVAGWSRPTLRKGPLLSLAPDSTEGSSWGLIGGRVRGLIGGRVRVFQLRPVRVSHCVPWEQDPQCCVRPRVPAGRAAWVADRSPPGRGRLRPPPDLGPAWTAHLAAEESVHVAPRSVTAWCGEVGAWLPADRGPPAETQLLLEVPPSTEDASSCQFPEEERGERSAEEKGRLGDLWV